MDSNELERERDITILAKNTAINFGLKEKWHSSTPPATPILVAK